MRQTYECGGVKNRLNFVSFFGRILAPSIVNIFHIWTKFKIPKKIHFSIVLKITMQYLPWKNFQTPKSSAVVLFLPFMMLHLSQEGTEAAGTLHVTLFGGHPPI